jgi:hypothetical protein
MMMMVVVVVVLLLMMMNLEDDYLLLSYLRTILLTVSNFPLTLSMFEEDRQPLLLKTRLQLHVSAYIKPSTILCRENIHIHEYTA